MLPASRGCIHKRGDEVEKVNQGTVAWQFVPVEPTPEMVHAMALAWQQAVDREDGNECIAEYRAALAAAPAAPQVAQPRSYTDDPSQTGVGAWCAPGPAAQQQRKFVLRFEDQDRGEAHYTDEDEARQAFAQAEARGWNCHLLAHVARAPQVAQPQDAVKKLAGLAAFLAGWKLSPGCKNNGMEGHVGQWISGIHDLFAAPAAPQVAQPLTDEQIAPGLKRRSIDSQAIFISGVRFAERAHGIGQERAE